MQSPGVQTQRGIKSESPQSTHSERCKYEVGSRGKTEVGRAVMPDRKERVHTELRGKATGELPELLGGSGRSQP